MAMTTQCPAEPFPIGTLVKKRNSGQRRARIVEFRGELGPEGASADRVHVRKKPLPAYIEVLEAQFEVAPAKG